MKKETQKATQQGVGNWKRKNKYSQYIGWGVTAFAVIAAGVLLYFGIDYMGKLIDALGKLLGVYSARLYGALVISSVLPIPSMTLYEAQAFQASCFAHEQNKAAP